MRARRVRSCGRMFRSVRGAKAQRGCLARSDVIEEIKRKVLETLHGIQSEPSGEDSAEGAAVAAQDSQGGASADTKMDILARSLDWCDEAAKKRTQAELPCTLRGPEVVRALGRTKDRVT